MPTVDLPKTTRKNRESTIADIKYTNQGATGTMDFELPPAQPGMEGLFERTDSQTMTVSPVTGEKFAGGTASKHKSLDADGTYMYIKCFQEGVWHILALFGTASDEA